MAIRLRWWPCCLFLCCFGVLLNQAYAENLCSAPLIRTSSGVVRGTCTTFSADDVSVTRDVAIYKGMRYAEPPTGPRRFGVPVPRELDREVDGSKPGMSCPQGPHPVYNTEWGTSEDCLFLDVFAPLPLVSAPVMVWLHGGGFMFGAGTVDMLSPLPLVALGDIIVVTINYRIGALGFLTTGDDEIPPNLGILDQIEALRWIQKHISSFGGDPSRVTLFGDSAGSSSVHLHLMSPMSSGLFQRAIMQSGAATSSWARGPSMERAETRASVLGTLLGCDTVSPSAELRACLMGVPADDFVGMQQKVLEELGDSADIAFVPVVDHEVIPDWPDVIGEAGRFNNVSLLIGANADEGMMAMMALFPHHNSTPAVNYTQFRRHLSNMFRVDDPALLDLIEVVCDLDETAQCSERHSYESENPIESDNGVKNAVEVFPNNDFAYRNKFDYFDALNEIIGDMSMFCPTRAVANFAANAGLEVYQYHMTHRPSESFWRPLTWTRVNHGENLLFVFGVHFMPKLNWTLTPTEVDMTLRVIQYWTNFASTGDPTGTRDHKRLVSNLQPWPRYITQTKFSKNLSPAMTNDVGVKTRICWFWNSILPRLQAQKNAE
ncbi:acetylcholinesterase-like [Diadema setosum]|uniref:acetylcholinesterase-like n=1 Tax=Diadema setosum TaxID=31175 RepID=UPI003B3BD39B